ncbi:MAG TPA: tetratricopeptide repeat protein [Rhodanobacteraceae bacterium]|nr:tetratricopeptide repeat protein [Rhodanobacteraceae bacterium]
MLKESIELHRQGRLEEAEQAYRAHLAEHADDPDALHLLGLLRQQRGDADEGRQLVERARMVAPDHAGILVSLGALRFQAGEHEDARAHFERALHLDPNVDAAHAGLGQIAAMRGERELAERHFRTALRADENPQALAGLGALALDRNDAEGALRYLTRAAELAPDDALVQLNLGRAFAARNTLAFAERAYTNALRLRPDLHEAHRLLGELLIATERHADAEPHFLALVRIPGFEAAAEVGLGDLARARGYLEDAVDRYRGALSRVPRQPGVVRVLGWSLVRLGRSEEALAAYEHYLALVPDDRTVRHDRADLLMRMGHLIQAAQATQALHDENPGDLQATIRLALLREQLGDPDAARSHAERALAMAPDDVQMALVSVRAHLRNGENAVARRLLDRLGRLALEPGNARRHSQYLGFVHDRAGEPAAAIACWTRAQRDAPSDMPPLDDPHAELDAALAEPPGPARSDAPVLLLGLPGSGVERIAALLADQPQLCVMHDRVGRLPRDDDFNRPRFAWYCGELGEAARAELRERYIGALRAAGATTDRPVVDWLPRWDAHLLALIRRAMPGTRLVIVESDLREALLNWIAFGWVPGFPCGDTDVAADWLLRARRHLAHGEEFAEPERLHVDADAVLADPVAGGAGLAQFLGLPTLVPGNEFAQVAHGLGGLPTRFAPGHWHQYRETLRDAFAKLAD